MCQNIFTAFSSFTYFQVFRMWRKLEYIRKATERMFSWLAVTQITNAVSNYIVFSHAHFLNLHLGKNIFFISYHFLKDSTCCNSLSNLMSPKLFYFSRWSIGFIVYIFNLLYHLFQHTFHVCFLCHLSGDLSSLCYSSSSKYNLYVSHLSCLLLHWGFSSSFLCIM